MSSRCKGYLIGSISILLSTVCTPLKSQNDFCGSNNIIAQSSTLQKLTRGKGQLFRYIYKGEEGAPLSTFKLFNNESAIILVCDNSLYEEYYIECTFLGQTDRYNITDTRTVLKEGERFIIYEAINEANQHVTFFGDPEFKKVVAMTFQGVQVLFTNNPKLQ
ncbi:hypothetical protein [Parabacteroides faecis]|uniref:Lipoprotein n=1 Tax=Parabacteroides faecis TaxID=1217282 RepID=A0ABR6KNQ8_9BACT|nr:hypothetical protein [Parabacteroides faecis]MBB4623132.1 hypothetical protein [Parabacteroides faecis]GGK00065.1 hypothetical protein GCM10007084_24320 [Parabacteroides faecis]